MKKNKVVVVIPVHSSSPSEEELLSFAQCYKILFSYNIVVVHPEGLDLAVYRNIVPQFATLEINPVWQSTLVNYNILKCSSFFYSLFSEYTFLLTYELDAYAFKDELEYWCMKGYDYIGAPWFEGWTKPKIPLKLHGVGNSGFSLRNVKSCSLFLNRINKLQYLNNIYCKLKIDVVLDFADFLRISKIHKLFHIKNYKYLDKLLSGIYVNEDNFWAIGIARTFKDFKVAPISDALKFSFEVEPRELYKMNNKQLPFGCHAWMKYSPTFWKQFIKHPHYN